MTKQIMKKQLVDPMSNHQHFFIQFFLTYETTDREFPDLWR